MSLSKKVKELEVEMWKKVTYPYVVEGRYEVSNHGRISDTETGELVEAKIANSNIYNGLFSVKLYVKNVPTSFSQREFLVQEIVAHEFHPSCLPDNLNWECGVIHLDHDLSNNRADNLEWVACEINEWRKELVYWACQIREYEGKSPKSISRIIPEFTERFLNKLIYEKVKHKGITELFDLSPNSYRHRVMIDNESLPVIEYMFALGVKLQDILQMLEIPMRDSTIRVIDAHYRTMLEKQEKGEIPTDGNDPRWDDICKQYPIIEYARYTVLF